MPYLPIDPADLGRSYEGLIRVNSQSGKGGIAYLLERAYGLALPRRLQVEFSALVQRLSDASEAEVGVDALCHLFESRYLQGEGPLRLLEHCFESASGQLALSLSLCGQPLALQGQGGDVLSAAMHALSEGLALPLRLDQQQAGAITLVELGCDGVAGARFGAGRHAEPDSAALLAFVSALNRLLQAEPQLLDTADCI